MFTFRLILLVKVGTHVFTRLYVKWYHYCFKKIDGFVIKQLMKADMLFSKEIKNKPLKKVHGLRLGLVWFAFFV